MATFFRATAYSIWFVCALFLFTYWSIPTDRVAKFAAHQATKKLKMKVTIGDLELHGLTGVTLKDVKVAIPIPVIPLPGAEGNPGHQAGGPGDRAVPGAVPAKKPTRPGLRPGPRPPKQPLGLRDKPGPAATVEKGEKEKAEQAVKEAAEDAAALRYAKAPGMVMLSTVRADVNTWDVLRGQKLQAQVAAKFTTGGELSETTFTAQEKGWHLKLGAMTGINLGPSKLFRRFLGTHVDGRLSGSGEITWVGNINGSSGALDITVSDTVVPFMAIDKVSHIAAYDVQAGELTLKLRLGKPDEIAGLKGARRINKAVTTLLIEELKANGEHVEVALEEIGRKNTLQFVGPKFGDTKIDVKFKVHFKDKFFAWKGDGHRPEGTIIRQESHAGMKGLLPMRLKAALANIDGKDWYGFHCLGRLKASEDGRLPEYRCRPTPPRRAPQATRPSAHGVGGARPQAGARPQQPGTPRPGMTRPTPSGRPVPGVRPTAAGAEQDPSAPKRFVDNSRKTRPAGKLIERNRPETDNRDWDRKRPANAARTPPDMLSPGERVGGGGEPTPTYNEPEPEPEGEEGEAEREEEEGEREEEEGEEGEEEGEEGEEGEEDGGNDEVPFDPEDEVEEY